MRRFLSEGQSGAWRSHLSALLMLTSMLISSTSTFIYVRFYVYFYGNFYCCEYLYVLFYL